MKDFLVYFVVIFLILSAYKWLLDNMQTRKEDGGKKKALATLEHRDKKIKKLEQDLRTKTDDFVVLTQELAQLKKSHEKEIVELKKESNSTIGKLQQKISGLQTEIMALESYNNSVPDVVDGPQPDKPSRYVLFHSCERKLAFKTMAEAEAAKDTFDARYEKEHKIYSCRYCGDFHLATLKSGCSRVA